MRSIRRRDIDLVDEWEEPVDGLEAELMTLAASKGGRTRPKAQKRPRSRAWVLRRALAAADFVGLLLALALTQTLAVRILEPQEIAITGLLIIGFPGWVLLAQMYGLYDHVEIGAARSTADDLPGLVLMCTFATWIGLLLVTPAESPTRAWTSRRPSGSRPSC